MHKRNIFRYFNSFETPVKVAYYGAFFNSFRLMASPISVAYLIMRGVSLSQIALLQLVLSISSTLISYPIGILCDRINQKILAYWAIIFIILYHLFYLKAPNLVFLFIAQIFLSFSLTIIDISISTWLTKETRQRYQDRNKIDYYSHLENEIEAISSFCISTLFIALTLILKNYYYFYETIYILTTVILGLLFVLLRSIPNTKFKNFINEICSHSKINYFESINFKLKTIFKSGKDYHIILYFLAALLIWFAYQPLFHYWQPLLMSKQQLINLGFYSFSFENINLLLGISYLCTNISIFLFHKIVKIYSIKFVSANFLIAALILTIVSAVVFYNIAVNIHNIIAAILYFSIMHGCMSVLWKITRNQFIKNSDPQNFGTIISISVASCRCLNIILFYTCFKICTSISDIQFLYKVCSIALISAGLIFLIWNIKLNRTTVEAKSY